MWPVWYLDERKQDTVHHAVAQVFDFKFFFSRHKQCQYWPLNAVSKTMCDIAADMNHAANFVRSVKSVFRFCAYEMTPGFLRTRIDRTTPFFFFLFSQVIPKDINWIIARAAQREAPFPSAFMSSKPDAGINHKVQQIHQNRARVFGNMRNKSDA